MTIKPPRSQHAALQWIAARSAMPVTTLEQAKAVIAEIALEANKALEFWQRQREQ